MSAAAEAESAIGLFCFYAYGCKGRAMLAIRAPFAAPSSGEGLIGRLARAQGKLCRIVAIARESAGPVAAGDPLGIEVSPVEAAGLQDLRDESLRST